MDYFIDIATNAPIVCAVLGWLIAQLLKIVVTAVVEKTVDFGKFMAPGGMPSSHSAFVTALAATVGWQEGVGSVYFALAAAFALIVMYDACGVRRAVGEQAKVINLLIDFLKEHDPQTDQETIRVILGHTPFQVVMGFILGLVIAFVYKMIMQ